MSASSAIESEAFLANVTPILTRMDLYPKESPTCYCVGITATINSTQRMTYADTQVPLADCAGLAPEAVAALGWAKLKPSFEAWYKVNSSKPAILGASIFQLTGEAAPAAATGDVGAATEDVGAATEDVGAATEDVGAATEDVGAAA